MAIKVYVISDRSLIDLIEDNDLDGFKEVLAEDDTLYFDAPEYSTRKLKLSLSAPASATAQTNAPRWNAIRSAPANPPTSSSSMPSRTTDFIAHNLF